MDGDIRARLEALHGEQQGLLVEFLNDHIDLAFTILKTAALDVKFHATALAKARAALRTIREFSGKVQNRAEWQRIHSRADQLEAFISRVFD